MNRKTTTLFSLGVSAVLIAVGIRLLYNYNIGVWPESNRLMPGNHGMMGDGMGIVMVIFWVVFIAALLLLISGVANGIRKQDSDDTTNALEILNRRYACGEIDNAEYEDKRKNLIN